jgi:DmsE family decaheme c-type cytochrome
MVHTRHVTRAGLALAVIGACVALSGGTVFTSRQTPPAKPAATAQAAPAAAADEYAGEDTCLVCHEGQSVKGTAHGRSYNERTPASTHGCESCHGPGKAHADAEGDKSKIKNPAKLGVREASAICTTCHDRAKHALWDGSQHDMRQVGCTSCHSVHSASGDKQLKAKSESVLCGTCHRNIVNRQYRFNHMPVREGKMTCSSCHNVHGTQNVKLLAEGGTVTQSCVTCHTEKRGPFLWEHFPVTESCTTCHDPHGTSNDRMLVAKQPFLCQRCHVTSRHPPTVYEGYVLQNSTNANKIYGRSCVVCHQQVHGSNAPSGKAFLR